MYRTRRDTARNRQTTVSLLPIRQQRSSIDAAEAVAAAFDLTPAEIRTLERLLRGSSPAEIASNFGVALPTVRTHLSNIFAKTGTARQRDLILLAVQFTTPSLRS
jgi:DNA-binding CsgD family transcriptional regulator